MKNYWLDKKEKFPMPFIILHSDNTTTIEWHKQEDIITSMITISTQDVKFAKLIDKLQIPGYQGVFGCHLKIKR